MMRRAYRIFGFFIGLIAAVAFTLYALRTISVEDLYRYTTSAVVAWIVIAAFIYSTIIPISAWAWREMLSNVGVSKSFSELAAIMAVTQIAKYLPGNVAQHIGRTAMSLTRGISIRPFVSTVFAETLLSILAALIVSLTGAAFSRVDFSAVKFGNVTALAIFAIALLILCLLSNRPLMAWLTQKLAASNTSLSLDDLLPQPSSLFKAFSAYSLNFILIGLVLWFLALMLFPGGKHNFMLLLCSFSLAWFVGFLAPGAPAGLGVREVILLGLLSTTYDDADGIFLIVALRIATILGDSICFLVGYMLLFSGRLLDRNSSDNHCSGK